MSLLKWSPDLDTGIPVIDKQHQRIVEYINQLNHAQQSSSREEVGEVLDQLVDYTLSHFTFEEELMDESGYRFVNAHKKVHKLFVRRVGDYVERFKTGEDITDELLASLKTWLVNHIKNDDSDYTEIVKESMGDEKKSGGWLSRSMKKIFG
ncbi:MAG: bacteriohemerythrin [Candidatus Sedimenticola sp. (ex Thyasira tokunagai)]